MYKHNLTAFFFYAKDFVSYYVGNALESENIAGVVVAATTYATERKPFERTSQYTICRCRGRFFLLFYYIVMFVSEK